MIYTTTEAMATAKECLGKFAVTVPTCDKVPPSKQWPWGTEALRRPSEAQRCPRPPSPVLRSKCVVTVGERQDAAVPTEAPECPTGRAEPQNQKAILFLQR